MLWIVSGPTSVGKSTFIEDRRCLEITGLEKGAPVILPPDHNSTEDLDSIEALYYYNTLRPLDLGHRRYEPGRPDQLDENFVPGENIDFRADQKWTEVKKSRSEKKALILIARKQTLIERISKRYEIENAGLMAGRGNEYPKGYWTQLLEKTNLSDLYENWFQELRRNNIPYVLINADDADYPLIESEEEGMKLLGEEPTGYTKEQIEQILRERKFEYHRVELPYGLHTRGSDRRETCDLIFPESLEGQSVLDVGCALGYFSFEAEARGAQKVVGVELKDSRFEDAKILKDIKQSGVDFRQQNIITDPPEEKFDHVIALNVIHHLTEPFRAMRQMAAITKKQMVLEFPTFSDKKFKKATGIRISFFYDRLPLVGVSSMSKADQTFVFTPSAIRQALTEHEKLFRKINIIRSPMEGRVIAICRK